MRDEFNNKGLKGVIAEVMQENKEERNRKIAKSLVAQLEQQVQLLRRIRQQEKAQASRIKAMDKALESCLDKEGCLDEEKLRKVGFIF